MDSPVTNPNRKRRLLSASYTVNANDHRQEAPEVAYFRVNAQLLVSDDTDTTTVSSGRWTWMLSFVLVSSILLDLTDGIILHPTAGTSSCWIPFAEAVDAPSMPSTRGASNRGSPNSSANTVDTGVHTAMNHRQESFILQEEELYSGDLDRPEETFQYETANQATDNDKQKPQKQENEHPAEHHTQSVSQSRIMRQKQRQKQRIKKHQTQSDEQPSEQQRQTEGGETTDTAHPQYQLQNHQNKLTTQADYDAYMHWCEAVLGIQSVVEIKEFEYVDHLQMLWEDNESLSGYEEGVEFSWMKNVQSTADGDGEDDSDGSESEDDISSNSDNGVPITTVRGLAAKHVIHVGDIVISIPLYSLLSVPTTIDHDPVLSRILGPEARQKYGWVDTLEYEVPLLVIAILYHRSLGKDSPLSHYIDLLKSTSTYAFPFLWSEKDLQLRTHEIGVEVRDLARGIRQDVFEMYDGVMGTLARERPEMFRPPDGYSANNDQDSEEWMYSYDNFRWAFAMVISRCHYLPIRDLDDDDDAVAVDKTKDEPVAEAKPAENEYADVPPANMPTDNWVEEAKNEERGVTEEATDDKIMAVDDDTVSLMGPTKHSFLAPLADLINFGPPCLSGGYNPEEHAFELIATCPFQVGQEITFYYSPACSDVIVANYGFLHPLVPPCASLEDWKGKSKSWEAKATLREEELYDVYRRMDLLHDELNELQSRLLNCDCEDDEKKEQRSTMNKDNAAPSLNKDMLHRKLRKDGNSIRHEVGVRGRMNDSEGTKGLKIPHDVEDLGL
ncbi:predicted protein [Thalassiosira pseudonana CCMP1335]|uniref:SET domain-containing protein n=1 Tax=Thalassiosira pseudonana TaxID=35128 RepID=B8CB66_THAPS|nr:predicted protein [Thalassiosira pseudonana CCMP1335]EED89074.1 predicted protein [Thalassiosira pseudonana CCMP1335]